MPAEALSAASALLPPASHVRPLFIAGEDFCSYASFHPAESKTEGEAGARKCFLEPDFEQRKEEQPPAPCSALRAHRTARGPLCNAREPLGGYHTIGMSKFELNQVYLVFRRLA